MSQLEFMDIYDLDDIDDLDDVVNSSDRMGYGPHRGSNYVPVSMRQHRYQIQERRLREMHETSKKQKAALQKQKVVISKLKLLIQKQRRKYEEAMKAQLSDFREDNLRLQLLFQQQHERHLKPLKLESKHLKVELQHLKEQIAETRAIANSVASPLEQSLGSCDVAYILFCLHPFSISISN